MKVGNMIIERFTPLGCLKNTRQKAAKKNFDVFIDYFTRLEEIAINRIVWDGLPKEIDKRFLEITINEEGKIVYFIDEYLGPVALPFAQQSRLDVYGNPVKRRAYGWNGYQRTLNPDNSVICWNNYLRTPTSVTLALFAERLAELERSIEVNVKSQKTPVVVLCDEHERLSYKNAYSDYDGNVPVIFGSKNLDLNNFKVLNTEAPFVALDLQILKRQIWNEALTYLGINNGGTEKRERQVSNESLNSQGSVAISRWCALQARQEAARELKEKFGWDVEVRWNDQLSSLIEELNPEIMENQSGSDVIKEKNPLERGD